MAALAAGTDLPADVLEAAAHWYVQLNDRDAGADVRQAWQAWLAADARHRRAWERMQALERRLGGLPRDIVVPTLNGARAGRRRTVKLLALLLAGGAAGLAARQSTPWQLATADHRTGTGEHRRIELADGGTLDLGTASAVDIDYGPGLRLLRLHAGEILVRTASDPRPFEVRTGQGRIRALGTRFSVRSDGDGRTRVAVFEHAVEIRPAHADGPPLRLEAGQRADFSAQAADAPRPVDAGQAAWAEGKLVAIDQRLEDFLAELARYRPGILGCDPAIADLRLSGAFRLADTDAVLDNLAASLPVRVRYRTRYWVRIEAR
ncbi:DUF4880 domain-containing protein [Pseudothauera rhizosphaerae]|uniref:DUF4880 domain-containing protein n=2 Tax=Pseudothauera rhizosphaerae TaxID=2565932 RepID=A0A4S4AUS2_9RHOO|nr:DUF4880 domain-containing protein [Pseudothauera rhizosphaerae]